MDFWNCLAREHVLFAFFFGDNAALERALADSDKTTHDNNQICSMRAYCVAIFGSRMIGLMRELNNPNVGVGVLFVLFYGFWQSTALNICNVTPS